MLKLPFRQPSQVPFAGYLRALVYLRPYRARFAGLFGLAFISTAVSLAQPYLSKALIDNALIRRDVRSLWYVAGLMAVCAGLSFILGMATTYLYTRVSALVLFDMRLTVFQKLQCMSPQYFAKTRTGDIVSRLNNDIGELQRLSSDTLLSLPSNLLFLFGSAAMMAILNVRLFAISIVVLPIGIWAMRQFQGRLRAYVQTMRQQSSDIGSFLIESILGMRVVVAFNGQARKDQEFRARNDAYVHTLLRMQITSFLAGALPGAVLTASVAILFLYGGSLVIKGVLTIGGLMAFMAYHGRLLSPVQSLMASYSALITGGVSLSRVLELLDMPSEVTERSATRPLPPLQGHLEFHDVAFGYEGRPLALQQVSARILPRKICIVVGASGAGKSTLIDLALRFYDPSNGSVTLDGCDLRDLKLADVRSAITVVDQLPFLFHSTIRENLTVALPAATKADLDRAVAQAGITDFIAQLPLGYETLVGERGLSVSTGQRQRLAIARALLRNPAVLILDEPTAALDPTAEFELGEALRRLAGTCTVVVATHRPAFLDFADQVIVMEHGAVVEQGQPRELMQRNSALARHFREPDVSPSVSREAVELA